MYQDSKRTCTAIVLLIKPFVSVALVAVAVVVCLNSLIRRRRRRRGRRLVKNEFIFYKRNSRLSKSVGYANGFRHVFKLNMQRLRSIPNEIRKISRRRPRSVDQAELGHLTLLFCRGRQRNVQKFITHVHTNFFFFFYSLNLLFSDVLVAVVVVVCLSSLLKVGTFN